MPCIAYYDPECEALARHFLADATSFTDIDALDLAGAIQLAIEDWWAARKSPVTDWQDPSLPAPSNPLIASPVSKLITVPTHSALTITGASGEPIVTLRSNGRVEINPSVTLDEAARAFWDAVSRLNGGR